MKKSLRIAILIALVAAIFTGCDNILSFNLFSLLDNPKIPTTAEFNAMDEEELLDAIE